MSTATGPKRFRHRFATTLSQQTAAFWRQPALGGMRLVAIIFVLLAVVGVVLDAIGIDSRFTVGPTAALLFFFVAWILSSRRVSQLIVGALLIAAFVLSIVFLILPVEELVSSLNKTMEQWFTTQQHETSASMSVAQAEASLSLLAVRHTGLSEDYDFRAATDALRQASQMLPKSDEDISEQLFRQFTHTVSDLLTKSAPFVFTMLMGLMGSAIAVSRQFVSNFQEKPAIWYLYRLLQGMIIALLVVYGLVAGMLSLGVSTGGKPIDIAKFDTNKYFIGFVSALAGLFSEHAFARLESVSATVFGKTSRRTGAQEEPGGVAAADQKSGEHATGRHDAGSHD